MVHYYKYRNTQSTAGFSLAGLDSTKGFYLYVVKLMSANQSNWRPSVQ